MTAIRFGGKHRLVTSIYHVSMLFLLAKPSIPLITPNVTSNNMSDGNAEVLVV
jgi:hypothetical protein